MNMRRTLAQIGMVAVTAYVLMGRAGNVSAQTNVAAPATNVIRHVTQEEYEEMSLKRVCDKIAQQTNVVRHLSKEDEEWAANALSNFVPPKPWPDASQTQATLKHCAAVLRSAIDTNEVELACSKLTNQPETAVALRDFSKAAVSNLDEFATVLTGPEIATYVGEGEYCAELSNSQNYFFFTFWYTNKFPRCVRSFEKRLPGGGLQIMGGDFYENGKLRVFGVTPRDSKGVLHSGDSLTFKEDGKLDRYWFAPKEAKP